MGKGNTAKLKNKISKHIFAKFIQAAQHSVPRTEIYPEHAWRVPAGLRRILSETLPPATKVTAHRQQEVAELFACLSGRRNHFPAEGRKTLSREAAFGDLQSNGVAVSRGSIKRLITPGDGLWTREGEPTKKTFIVI